MQKNLPENKILYDKLSVIAELYYQYDLSQPEIAKRLSISRPWVSKLLKRAKEMGIIKIEITTSSASIISLEETLKMKYGLTSAKIVKNINDSNILEKIGKATG